MNDDNKARAYSVVMIIVDIIAVILAGALAWDWVDPDDFGSGLLFVIAWIAISSVACFLVTGIFLLIARLIN